LYNKDGFNDNTAEFKNRGALAKKGKGYCKDGNLGVMPIMC